MRAEGGVGAGDAAVGAEDGDAEGRRLEEAGEADLGGIAVGLGRGIARVGGDKKPPAASRRAKRRIGMARPSSAATSRSKPVSWLCGVSAAVSMSSAPGGGEDVAQAKRALGKRQGLAAEPAQERRVEVADDAAASVHMRPAGTAS